MSRLFVLQVLAECEASKRPLPVRAKERLQNLMKWQMNWEAIILDQELLQHSVQFFCMAAEWITTVAYGATYVELDRQYSNNFSELVRNRQHVSANRTESLFFTVLRYHLLVLTFLLQ